MASPEHVDVLIIGAGLSGIGAAHHLGEQCPDKSYLILESKESFGGTWLQHTYPGVRSDSDLYTYGYSFRPWTGKPIAEGAAILEYLKGTVDEDGIEQHMRFHHEVRKASWSTEHQQWLLEVWRQDTGTTVTLSCNYLWMCQGYYRHSEGYTPEWPGMSDFQGQVVHPQTWPADLDYAGKRVVVIGSGATAVTLIPNMSDDCGHITMLQRSPTYIWTGENQNPLADQLRELDVPDEWTHEIVRRSILKQGSDFLENTTADPEPVKEALLDAIRGYLGEDFDMSHFTPSYRLWQQRLCYVPDGDLFKAIKAGKVSVVTDHIERFTEHGILTQSGELLEADIIITATGFNLAVMGDIDFDVDGNRVDFSQTFSYRGIMNSGVPNLFYTAGSPRNSYTMRVDLVCDFVCRLLNHMDEQGASQCTPTPAEQDRDMVRLPWVNEDFNPGYAKRGSHLLPVQSNREPWIFNPDYYLEKDQLPAVDLSEPELVYIRRTGFGRSA